jgi:hypothetical protein
MVTNNVYKLILQESEEQKKTYDYEFFNYLVEDLIKEHEKILDLDQDYPLTFTAINSFYESNFEPLFQTILDNDFNLIKKQI